MQVNRKYDKSKISDVDLETCQSIIATCFGKYLLQSYKKKIIIMLDNLKYFYLIFKHEIIIPAVSMDKNFGAWNILTI